MVKEVKKLKKSKNKKKKSKRKRRKSDGRDDSSEEEADLSSSDLSPQTFKKKAKKRSRGRHRSSSKKRDLDKKARKKSQSLDPTDLRFSLKTASLKTIAKALSNLGKSEASTVKKKSKRSVEVSNDNHDGRDKSSSIFHMSKSVRRVERVVEIERQSSSKSIERTNPYSNAEATEGRRSRKDSWRRHDKSGDEGSALKYSEVESSHRRPTSGSSSGRHRSPPRWKERSKDHGKFKSGPSKKFRR